MALEEIDINASGTISGTTVIAGVLYVGGNQISPTDSSFTSLSATTFSAGTIYSGTTDLYNIFATIPDQNDITRVQPGSNITTGGTGNNPTINLVASPSVNGFTASGSSSLQSLSATSIVSGVTDLNVFFNQDRAQINTKANLSGATFTGQVNTPSLSATTLSGGTIFSATTDIYTIFAKPNLVVNNVNAGSNIVSGGTAISPTINLNASPSINGLTLSGTGNANAFSATTFSAGTINSGTTNLYNIFATIPDQNDITRVQPGSNITTGGTGNNPTINLVASPSINGLTLSGTGNANALSATTLSGGTIYSATTDIYTIFAKPNLVVNNVNAGSNITTGGTAISPTINLNASPSINNLTLSGTGNVNALSATTLSATTYYNDTQQIFGVFRGASSPNNTGNTWVRSTDSEMFVYDTSRAKWLSPNENYFGASRSSNNSTNLFLRYWDSLPMNTTPFKTPFDLTITKIIANGASSQTWKAFILTGTTTSTDVVLTLNLTSQNYSAKTDYDLNVTSGSSLYLYCSGSSIDSPTIMVYYKQKG